MSQQKDISSESSWVIVDNIDVAEEAVEINASDKLTDLKDMDMSDDKAGIEKVQHINESSTKESQDRPLENEGKTQDNQRANGIKSQDSSDRDSDSISILSGVSSLNDCNGKNEKQDDANMEESEPEYVWGMSDNYVCKDCLSDDYYDYLLEDMWDRSREPSSDVCTDSLVDNYNDHLLEEFWKRLDAAEEAKAPETQSENESHEIKADISPISTAEELEQLEPEQGAEENNIVLQYILQLKKSSYPVKSDNSVFRGTILMILLTLMLFNYLSSAVYWKYWPSFSLEDSNEHIIDSLPKEKTYDVPSSLTYCTDKHKSDYLYREANVQKCLKKIDRQIKRAKEKELLNDKAKYLQVKERYLNEREKFLIKKEYEILESEMKLNRENRQNAKAQIRSNPEFKYNLNQTKYRYGNSSLKKVERNSNEPKIEFDPGITTDSKYSKKKVSERDDEKIRMKKTKMNKTKNTGHQTLRILEMKKRTYDKYRFDDKKVHKMKNSSKFYENKTKDPEEGKSKTKENKKKNIDVNRYFENNSRKLDTSYRNSHNKKHKRYKFRESYLESRWYFDRMRGRAFLRYIEQFISN